MLITTLAPAGESPDSTTITVGLLSLIVGIVGALISIRYMTRRMPPIEQEIDKRVEAAEKRQQKANNDNRQEIQRLQQKHSNDLRKVYERIERQDASIQSYLTQLSNTVNKGFQDLTRQVGNFEGRLHSVERHQDKT